MSEKNTRKQIRTLYLMTTVGYFQIAAHYVHFLSATAPFAYVRKGILQLFRIPLSHRNFR